MSRLLVTLHAQAADLAGCREARLDLPAGATCRDVKRALVREHPALGPLVERSVLGTDREYLADAAAIGDAREVHFLPPVSGG